jgi:glycosyltransferase involved in cell wall biosynthesis
MLHDMRTTSPHTSTLADTSPLTPPADTHAGSRQPQVEIVIPVYNEQDVLAASVRTLHRHLTESTPFTFQITIADNASTDSTLAVAHMLAIELPAVGVLHLDEKGRGRALRAAWGTSQADVVAYMDVDLSTDLSYLRDLIEPLIEGRGDIAIGSRLAVGSRTSRSARREFISRTYNLILRVSLSAGFSDAQCGFKAGRRAVIQALLPQVQDEQWFFDTELLHLAQRSRFSILEVPVRWVEDPDSSVNILATAHEDLRGVMRLRRAMHTPAGGAALGSLEQMRPAGSSAAHAGLHGHHA